MSFLTLSVFAQNQLLELQTNKGRIYKNYLKTSYELSNYDDWLSRDDIYFKGVKYPFGGLLDQCHCQIDINGDGLEDIFYNDLNDISDINRFLATSINKSPSVFMNTGTKMEKIDWTGPSIIDPMASEILVGDFNNDSLPDLFSIVAYDTPNGIEGDYQISNLLLNSKDGFKTVIEFPHQAGYHHTGCSGDIDNDGDLDVIMFNFGYWENFITSKILWNDGNANFTFSEAGFSRIAPVHRSQLFDVNKDGFLDLVISQPLAKYHVDIMWGNGKDFDLSNSSSFETIDYPVGSVIDIDFTDVDNNGMAEIILSGHATSYVSPIDSTHTNVYYIQLFQSDDNGKTFTNKTKQYFDVTSFPRFANMSVKDLDKNGKTDIYSGDRKDSIRWEWNETKFIYKYPKTLNPPIISDYEFKNNFNINIIWKGLNPSELYEDSQIVKWAIYWSDKQWTDTSLVSKIYVSAKDALFDEGLNQFVIEATSKEMYIRVAAIDVFGVVSGLSNLLNVTIPKPIITSATVCEQNNLTIVGTDFFGITGINIGDYPVDYKILSGNIILAELSEGQSGSISLISITDTLTYSDIKTISSPSQALSINGNNSPYYNTIETYNVPEIDGVTFEWTFPQGWELISGSNTNIVQVKIGTTDGTIKVSPSAICGSLEQVSLPVAVYTYVPDDNFQKALREIGIDIGNEVDAVLTSSVMNVSDLNVESKVIRDLTGIQDFESLKRLDCSNNQLEVLDLSKNIQLEELSCSGNKLNSLDISKNDSLKALFCDGNKLTELNVTQNKVLYSLGCGVNPLTSLNVSQNKELVLLSIYSSTISSIDLSQNSHLFLFHCGFNQLTNLDISKNLELRELACDANQITKLDLSKNTKLTHVICNGNKLTSLNLKNGNNSTLTEMYADGNPDLTCINVDNPSLSETYTDWHKDITANYSNNCVSTGIELLELNKSIVVKPNPSGGIFSIEGLPANQKNNISVHTIDGKLIRSKISNSANEIIDLSNNDAGIYMLQINGQDFKISKK